MLFSENIKRGEFGLDEWCWYVQLFKKIGMCIWYCSGFFLIFLWVIIVVYCIGYYFGDLEIL